ncbi:CoB--CoM heterodisulfide reductase iron-sulfur subunit A family protein [Desulfopila inferna]|nr:CoB--CoM heterodisulfide reductase iron-sulfur subunit A family protein [Desulfopila inferna]MBM9603432.1 CoB--CoM heterodisulfide reductase iron-sulfur subunit A family protein [Desulfopila inferna]
MLSEPMKVGSVLIVGGGVTGMQAALDLADSGYYVYLIERTGAIGGAMSQLDKTFPTNDCSMCILAPKMVECGRHLNIKILTLSEVTRITGTAGNFRVTVNERPRFVDPGKCIACGICAAQCPKTVDNEYDASTGKRKAVYVKYAQAVPLKYQIDPDACLRLQKPGSCGICEQVCVAGAINFDDSGKVHELSVGALILAPGFEAFDPAPAGVWGYGKFPNVITSLQLERYLSATGPTQGHLLRPSDGKPVRKIAFLQCVGSRDENRCGNGYCSSVCCMYAIKEAVIAKQHFPGMSAAIYYMDMRTHGKDFDTYMEKAKTEDNVRFVRCRVHGVEPSSKNGDLRLHYINEEGRQMEELFDMVVLSVGLRTPRHVRKLAEIAGIQLSASNFASTSDFAPVTTSKEGIFTCGAFSGPKEIPQCVVEGSAAAAAVAGNLAPVRGEMRTIRSYSEERSVAGEEARIGVFVCHCGSNISDIVDVAELEQYASGLPGVVHVERNLFSCSQETQEILTSSIREKGLNRVVIAACTPRTHEPLFRETLKSAGLNEYLLEMANIRNQNSWVHDSRFATLKAKDLVRMAVAKVIHAAALQPVAVPIIQKGLVVGGGIAGMTAALNLANQGFEVDLVEKSDRLGGNALNLKHTFSGVHIPMQVAKLIDRVNMHEKINLHTETEVSKAEGFVGNFKTTLKSPGRKAKTVEHGIGIMATGAHIFRPTEYGYKQIRCVVTAIEFEKLHELKEKHVKRGKSFVFIQCVGSREKGRMYCSKVCCTHSVQSAIELKREDPTRNVYILYRDMRTYGEREYLFKKAREMGVVFINYELHGKPQVEETGRQILVNVWDHVLHRPVRIKADMVILATAIVADMEINRLAQHYRIPLDSNGFFQEAHAKLRPVDFTTEGIFTAGLAQYPKPVDESISQALAASARATTLLSRKEIYLDALKAVVNEHTCDGCALCIDVCPYHAIELIEIDQGEGAQPRKLVRINNAKCKGCGLCQGTCPMRGIDVAGFTMEQLGSQIKAALL